MTTYWLMSFIKSLDNGKTLNQLYKLSKVYENANPHDDATQAFLAIKELCEYEQAKKGYFFTFNKGYLDKLK